MAGDPASYDVADCPSASFSCTVAGHALFGQKYWGLPSRARALDDAAEGAPPGKLPVLEAHSSHLGNVLLKPIGPRNLESHEFLERLLRANLLGGRCRRVLGFVICSDPRGKLSPWLAYISQSDDWMTVRDELQRAKRIPTWQALEIACTAASALVEVHGTAAHGPEPAAPLPHGNVGLGSMWISRATSEVCLGEIANPAAAPGADGLARDVLGLCELLLRMLVAQPDGELDTARAMDVLLDLQEKGDTEAFHTGVFARTLLLSEDPNQCVSAQQMEDVLQYVINSPKDVPTQEDLWAMVAISARADEARATLSEGPVPAPAPGPAASEPPARVPETAAAGSDHAHEGQGTATILSLPETLDPAPAVVTDTTPGTGSAANATPAPEDATAEHLEVPSSANYAPDGADAHDTSEAKDTPDAPEARVDAFTGEAAVHDDDHPGEAAEALPNDTEDGAAETDGRGAAPPGDDAEAGASPQDDDRTGVDGRGSEAASADVASADVASDDVASDDVASDDVAYDASAGVDAGAGAGAGASASDDVGGAEDVRGTDAAEERGPVETTQEASTSAPHGGAGTGGDSADAQVAPRDVEERTIPLPVAMSAHTLPRQHKGDATSAATDAVASADDGAASADRDDATSSAIVDDSSAPTEASRTGAAEETAQPGAVGLPMAVGEVTSQPVEQASGGNDEDDFLNMLLADDDGDDAPPRDDGEGGMPIPLPLPLPVPLPMPNPPAAANAPNAAAATSPPPPMAPGHGADVAPAVPVVHPSATSAPPPATSATPPVPVAPADAAAPGVDPNARIVLSNAELQSHLDRVVVMSNWEEADIAEIVTPNDDWLGYAVNALETLELDPVNISGVCVFMRKLATLYNDGAVHMEVHFKDPTVVGFMCDSLNPDCPTSVRDKINILQILGALFWGRAPDYVDEVSKVHRHELARSFVHQFREKGIASMLLDMLKTRKYNSNQRKLLLNIVRPLSSYSYLAPSAVEIAEAWTTPRIAAVLRLLNAVAWTPLEEHRGQLVEVAWKWVQLLEHVVTRAREEDATAARNLAHALAGSGAVMALRRLFEAGEETITLSFLVVLLEVAPSLAAQVAEAGWMELILMMIQRCMYFKEPKHARDLVTPGPRRLGAKEGDPRTSDQERLKAARIAGHALAAALREGGANSFTPTALLKLITRDEQLAREQGLLRLSAAGLKWQTFVKTTAKGRDVSTLMKVCKCIKEVVGSSGNELAKVAGLRSVYEWGMQQEGVPHDQLAAEKMPREVKDELAAPLLRAIRAAPPPTDAAGCRVLETVTWALGQLAYNDGVVVHKAKAVVPLLVKRLSESGIRAEVRQAGVLMLAHMLYNNIDMLQSQAALLADFLKGIKQLWNECGAGAARDLSANNDTLPPGMDTQRHILQALLNITWANERMCTKLREVGMLPYVARVVDGMLPGQDTALKLLKNMAMPNQDPRGLTLRQMRDQLGMRDTLGRVILKHPDTPGARLAQDLHSMLLNNRA